MNKAETLFHNIRQQIESHEISNSFPGATVNTINATISIVNKRLDTIILGYRHNVIDINAYNNKNNLYTTMLHILNKFLVIAKQHRHNTYIKNKALNERVNKVCNEEIKNKSNTTVYNILHDYKCKDTHEFFNYGKITNMDFNFESFANWLELVQQSYPHILKGSYDLRRDIKLYQQYQSNISMEERRYKLYNIAYDFNFIDNNNSNDNYENWRNFINIDIEDSQLDNLNKFITIVVQKSAQIQLKTKLKFNDYIDIFNQYELDMDAIDGKYMSSVLQMHLSLIDILGLDNVNVNIASQIYRKSKLILAQ